jgi:DNA gyrase subunit A
VGVSHYVTVELSRTHLREALDIIDGLLLATNNWHEVSDRIYGSADRVEARERLGQPPLSLSPVQAEHVLDMSVGRRTMSGREALTTERERLQQAINGGTSKDV